MHAWMHGCMHACIACIACITCITCITWILCITCITCITSITYIPYIPMHFLTIGNRHRQPATGNQQPATATGTGNRQAASGNRQPQRFVMVSLWDCCRILRFVCDFFMVGFGLPHWVGVSFMLSGRLRVSLWFLKSLFWGSKVCFWPGQLWCI